MKRSVAMIVAQQRVSAGSALAIGAMLGLIFVPAAGWPLFLAWYALLALGMIGRQPYIRRLVERDGPTESTLRRIAVVAACTSWLAILSVPLFSRFVSVVDLGVLTVLTVGWVAVAVSVLAVQPRVYAVYLGVCLLTVYLAWVPQVNARQLVLIGVSMFLGAPMMVGLAKIVQAQLRDAVEAAQQNAVLVQQLLEALRNEQAAQQARSRFLGAASHDLRQPVQALMFLSDIFRRSTDAARRDAMAQQIVRTSESIDGMFHHLVDFAQIDAGKMKAVVQPVQLDQLVVAAIAGFAEKCAARGLRFRLQMDAPCTVAADPVLLERILRNFLDNALKYSLQGEIVLRVECDGDAALVHVCDEGVGMEEDDLAQACSAFFRGRSASVAEAEGIGLGLAISRHMAELMRGRLHIESQPGKGTRATVRLPLAGPDAAAPLQPSPRRRDALLHNRLVAVVENDRQTREALCAWLMAEGARVAQAPSVAGLREVLRNADTAPDLLLADYRLADGTGVEAIEAVRATYGWVPAWILSGEPDLAERGLDLPVLQKPITPDRLMDALRAAFPTQQSADGQTRR